MTAESLKEAPKNSTKELLTFELNKARQIGFVTYCLVAKKEIPQRIETNFKKFNIGEYNAGILKKGFEDREIFIGVEMTEVVKEKPNDPESVLNYYKKFLEEYSEELDKSKDPPKSSLGAIKKHYPQLSNDSLLDKYWPDIFAVAFRGTADKAFWQYLHTHLRATVFGFAQAAVQFKDTNIITQALKLLKESNNLKREDPLKIARMTRIN
jgi:hypothetical protein